MLDILSKPEELRMDFLLKGKIKDKGLKYGSIARSILCPSLESHRNWVFASQKIAKKTNRKNMENSKLSEKFVK